MFTNKDIQLYTKMYPDELKRLTNFLKKHSHTQPNNISPTKFILIFKETSLVTIPSVKCWCGEELELAGEDRMNMI